MTNIIGDDVLDLQEFFCSGERKVHLYGKEHALPDRKMGHITRRWNTSDARTM
jgi:phosphoribosylaminoimidazole carboxylase (NCAIR synthetase)